MKTKASYIRLTLFVCLSFVVIMYATYPENPTEVLTETWFWLMQVVLVVIGVSAEACVAALQSILFRTLSEEKQAAYLAAEAEKKEAQLAWFNNRYQKLLGSKPIEKEHEIILDHNYDGIKELDNNLPPWWVYSFYLTILFAVIYLVRYHIFDDNTQAEEYEIEVAEARKAIEEYKKTAKDLVDVNSVQLLTDASDLDAGKAIFNGKCIACHKKDGGGGIGPNLTDMYWILGGGIKNVFKTISEGGRSGKGMVPWKTELKPSEIAQVASYVLSLQGTTPSAPKEPQGEIWVNPDAPKQEPKTTIIDSTSVTVK